MSYRKGRIDNARREANKLLRRFGVEAAKDVNVEGFAARLHIHLIDAKLHGATAQLVVGPDHASIILSDVIVDMGVRRWAVAHELGHYILGHSAPPPETLLAPHPRYVHLALLPDDEVEADCFALTLLTPECTVRSFHDVRPMTLLAPMLLASACGVSPEAGAIRIAELTGRACAVVISHGAKILVAAPGPRFVEAFGMVLVPGRPIDRRSVASRYLAGEAVPQRPEMVPSAAWLDVRGEPPLLEHSLPGTVPGTVLTMLWAPHRDADRKHRQRWDRAAPHVR
jgi:Zn-dependent peptidase ImmA (M78 family)